MLARVALRPSWGTVRASGTERHPVAVRYRFRCSPSPRRGRSPEELHVLSADLGVSFRLLSALVFPRCLLILVLLAPPLGRRHPRPRKLSGRSGQNSLPRRRDDDL